MREAHMLLMFMVWISNLLAVQELAQHVAGYVQMCRFCLGFANSIGQGTEVAGCSRPHDSILSCENIIQTVTIYFFW